MKLDTLFDNYDLLMDSPNSTVKMRKLILQLAVQGKLVEQDPNDEPASELLKRIKAEKEKLIAEGKIKKQKPFSPIAEDEILYELPNGWEWVRLGNLTQVITKGSSPKWQGIQYVGSDEGLLFLTSKNVGNYNLILDNSSFVEWKFNEIEPRSILQNGDILMNIVGASIGRTALYDLDEIANINQAVCLIRFLIFFSFDKRYFLHFFNSPVCISYMFDKQVDMARPNLSMGNIERFLVPVPPVAEQKRIVAKLDQLMHLCDQLDACQKKASTKYESLNDAALEKLLSSKTIDEFAGYWQFLCNNFDLIYNDPAHVNKLRQAILQLAVQGKLAPQDPNDEPAGKLLKRIKAEKEKLIAEGKIKKQKPLQPIGGDEIPYELPQGWEWVRLDDVCSYIQRGKGPRYIDNSDFLVVSQKCIQWNGFQIEKARFIDPASLDKYAEERFLQTGDLLWNSTGTGTIGRLCVYNHGDNPYDKVVSDSHVTVVRPLVINSEYLFCFLASPVIQTGFEDRASGTTNQIELATSTVKNQVVALAPVTEQKRIVSKVDQLMHLCDELETRLNQSKNDSEMLMQAVLHEAFS